MIFRNLHITVFLSIYIYFYYLDATACRSGPTSPYTKFIIYLYFLLFFILKDISNGDVHYYYVQNSKKKTTAVCKYLDVFKLDDVSAA